MQGNEAEMKAKMSKMIEDAVASTSSTTGKLGLWSYKEHPSVSAMAQSEVEEFLSTQTIAVTNCPEKGTRPITDFKQAGFPKELEALLCEFPKPTAIQSVTWPPILTGRDLVGVAATGSGKTLAFGVPALLYIRNLIAQSNVSGNPKRRIRALIMSPTRELAMQIQDTMEKFGQACGITSLCLYGGAAKNDQRKVLRSGADVIVATPGRLIDFMEEGECDLSDVGFFVLDEADRMLDMGFEPNIKQIAAAIKNKDRQTVMFSATWPPTVVKLSQQYLKNPVHVTVGSVDLSANANIVQKVEVLDPKNKQSRLLSLLKDYHKTRKNRIIVFALYKKEAANLEGFLQRQGYNVKAIHGDLTQDKRTEAINSFRDGTCPLLIATDVAARGIDVKDVEYVINFTYPLTTEDYCHRIGRTGRAGKKGIAHTFFTMHDKSHSGALINVLKQAKQNVPEDLMKFGTTVKKKVDANYGAFTRDIDPNAKATKITFDD
ncbi:RNA-dependent ATPase [Blyttiomyces sp. JEL0837]|nr:RNA-dependent ATPase [Blyttiomyces sp. JEL0837]